MPILDAITISGFKSIRAVEELRLHDINIVIGPNGAGKSNFIEAFKFLHAIRQGRLQEYAAKAGGADRLLHFGAKETENLFLGISFKGGQHQYAILLNSDDADGLVVAGESAYFSKSPGNEKPNGMGIRSTGKEAGISGSQWDPIFAHVRDHLTKWRLYHFHDTSSSSPMKKTAEVNDNRFLRPDGSNLAAFLYLLKQKHPESYQLIRKSVQRVAPFFDDFALEPLALNENTIRLEWRHKKSDRYFDAASLSDGTLRFIGLATLFLQPKALRPSVILVDEPELGLHPFAITMFASILKQAAAETQVIVATQSPHLLDHFSPEDVLVANQVDGATEFERLDSGRLSEWLEDYSLGQLWEKNEFAGRPAAYPR
ncbi:MAG: AAA family ATPase [Verrucomicrobiales bacterium]